MTSASPTKRDSVDLDAKPDAKLYAEPDAEPDPNVEPELDVEPDIEPAPKSSKNARIIVHRLINLNATGNSQIRYHIVVLPIPDYFAYVL